MKFEFTLNPGSCIGSLPCIFVFSPSFLTPLYVVYIVFLCSLPPTPLIHWFSGLSVLYEFSFPPFITWSLTDALLSGSLSLFFMHPPPLALLSLAASCRFPCSFFSLSFSPTKTAYKDQQPCHLNKRFQEPSVGWLLIYLTVKTD